MLLNSLIQIGMSLQTNQKIDTDLEPELVSYLDLKYSNAPKTEKIIKIIIKPCILKRFEIIKQQIATIDLNNYINVKIKKENRATIIGAIIKKINPDLTEFKKCIETELIDYKKELNYMMLRGEQKGTTIYFSPTMTSKISSKKLKEFPLWKINLSSLSDSGDEKLEEDEAFIRDFFKNIPSLNEYKRISNNDPNLIFKTILSNLFLSVLNDLIADYNLKSGTYYFPLCFSNKWPYEYDIFKKYYKNKLTTSAKEGLCEGCGKRVPVSKGLTGELGFFSTDQKSFQYSFFVNTDYQLCNQCRFYVEKGFIYVKENLNLYLGSRGTRKNPIEMYILPICEDAETLPEILRKIDFNRDLSSSKNHLKRIQSGAEAAIRAQESQTAKGIKPSNSDFLNCLINFGIEGDSNKHQFSLLLITFYHPEGQSSAFHNIISAELLNYDKIITLGQTLSNLEKEGERFYLKDIFFIFGIHKFRTYISNLLNLHPLNLSTLCKDAYLNFKIDFFKFMADLGNTQTYIPLNLKRLNTFITLAGRLNIL